MHSTSRENVVSKTVHTSYYTDNPQFLNQIFRLVLIAEKTKVHKDFPIPLINRLEKHYMSATSLLDANQKEVKKKLENWMGKFVKPSKADG